MSFMFNRFPPPSRRAIYFAREAALNMGASEIDPTHLLGGLTVDQNSRVNTVFKLDQRLSDEAAQMRSMSKAADQKVIPLTKDMKQILRLAEDEANRLNSYWIDTDHLTLGLLRAKDSIAGSKLATAGLEIHEARRIIERCTDRPDYGCVPALWWLSKPISHVGHRAAIMYLLLVVVLFKFLAGRSC